MYYPIEVSGNNYLYKKYNRRLLRYGLSFDNGIYIGAFPENQVKKIQLYCQKRGLKCSIVNSLGTRSQNYRYNFFKVNKPNKKNKYRCVYCGRYKKKKDITVDHIFPVNAGRNSIKIQKMMRARGIYDINDTRNLVPACGFCNSLKRAKMGIWIPLAYIGKSNVIWKIRYTFRWLVLIGFICLLIGVIK